MGPLKGVTYVTDIGLEGIYEVIEYKYPGSLSKNVCHVSGGRGRGSKFLPLNFNTLFVHVSQKSFLWPRKKNFKILRSQ